MLKLLVSEKGKSNGKSEEGKKATWKDIGHDNLIAGIEGAG